MIDSEGETNHGYEGPLLRGGVGNGSAPLKSNAKKARHSYIKTQVRGGERTGDKPK